MYLVHTHEVVSPKFQKHQCRAIFRKKSSNIDQIQMTHVE